MKTQVFPEQQLKDLVAGKEAVTIESVKKDENYADKIFPNERVRRIYFVSKNAKELFRIGDVVQAVNEKGEKQRFCDFCSNIGGVSFEEINRIGCGKPLLVRLEKIERESALEIFYESKMKYDKEVELKTWRQKNE